MTKGRERGQMAQSGAFAASGISARGPRLLDPLPGGRFMGESRVASDGDRSSRLAVTSASPVRRSWPARARARLLDWGWWPEPLHEHWVLTDREIQRRIDRLEDGLITSLLTSRSVGEGKKKEIERVHRQIKALRVYRWRQTS